MRKSGFFTNHSGFTLVEVVIAGAIFAIVSLITAGLMVDTANFATTMNNENNRAQVMQQVVRTIRNPAAIQGSLTLANPNLLATGALNCLTTTVNSPACGVLGATDFSLAGNRAMANVSATDPNNAWITGSQGAPTGYGYYTAAGKKCTPDQFSDGKACPILVHTQVSVSCPGVGRTTCPAAQAAVTLSYSVGPNSPALSSGSTATGLQASQMFAPIAGDQTLKMSDLYSSDANPTSYTASTATTTGDAGVTSRLSTVQDRQTASVTVGAATTGGRVANVCPTPSGSPSVMTGINADGSVNCASVSTYCARGQIFTGFTQSGTSWSPICVDITCSTGLYFAGFKANGTKDCKKIAPTTTACLSYTGTNTINQSSTQFLTAVDNFGNNNTCHQLTCAPGQITACWSGGNVQCVTTDFIPRCSNCNHMAGLATIKYIDSTSGVSAPFESYPFVSQWYNGEPIQGFRQSYRDWGSGQSTNSSTLTGLYGDMLGSGTLLNGACQPEPGTQGGSQNLSVTHSWYTYYYYPNNGFGFGAWQQNSEPCSVTPNYGNGTATATNCRSGIVAGQNCSFPDLGPGGVGQVSCDSYTGWTIRMSCDYYYNNPNTKCGGAPTTPVLGINNYTPPAPTPVPTAVATPTPNPTPTPTAVPQPTATPTPAATPVACSPQGSVCTAGGVCGGTANWTFSDFPVHGYSNGQSGLPVIATLKTNPGVPVTGVVVDSSLTVICGSPSSPPTPTPMATATPTATPTPGTLACRYGHPNVWGPANGGNPQCQEFAGQYTFSTLTQGSCDLLSGNYCASGGNCYGQEYVCCTVGVVNPCNGVEATQQGTSCPNGSSAGTVSFNSNECHSGIQQ